MNKWIPFIKYLMRYKVIVFNLIISSFVLTALFLLYPCFFKLIIDSLLNKNYSLAYIIISISFISGFISIFLAYIRGYLQSWLHNKILLDYRKYYYVHILNLPMNFFHNFQTGKIAQRLFEDVDIVIGTVLGTTMTVFLEVIKFIFIFIVVITLGAKFIILSLVVIIFYIINFNLFKTPIENSSKEIGQKTGDLYSKFYDIIPGIKEIKTFTKEKMESHIFVHELCNLFRLKMKNFNLFNTMNSIASIVPNITSLIALYFCIREVILGNITIGTIFLITSYLNMIRGPVEALSGVLTSLKQASPAIDRLNEIIKESKEQSGNVYISKNKTKLNIRYSNVNFSYDKQRSVLKNINISFNEGKTYALVGPTGAGKTTITNLLLRFYQPDSGSIKIAESPVSEINLRILRELIGIVPQDPHIFHTTIKNNIAFGKKWASEEEILNTVKAANLYDFVMELPDKLNSMVGERGVKLSGGEKQRIAIARAMLKNPPILVLDEATSSLDSKTEALIQEAIQRLIKDRTTIAIAHRLSTIINSDQIIVMNNGEIVELGNHDELLKTNNLYASLYNQQFKHKDIT